MRHKFNTLVRRLLVIMLAVSSILPANVLIAESSALSTITAKIEQLKKLLLQKQTNKTNLQDELNSIESQISQVHVRLYTINKNIKVQQAKLQPLQAQQKQLQQQLTDQRAALSDQLRAAYQMGQQTQLQVLLTQQNSADTARMIMYYQTLNKARENLIRQYLQNLAGLQANQDQINQVLNELEALKQKRVGEQQVLQQKIVNRKPLLKQINHQIQTSQDKIAQLEADKKHLQNVVDNLTTNVQFPNVSGKSFAQLQHKLPWPVVGRITRHYGDIYDGQMHSNGVFISAPSNTPVRAIASGQVIFASWMRGYGNMIIVSHNDSYMTLYGHNDAMLVQVGQNVQAGDELGLVGTSGGLVDPGLYFEVRYQGKTRDPALWCH